MNIIGITILVASFNTVTCICNGTNYDPVRLTSSNGSPIVTEVIKQTSSQFDIDCCTTSENIVKFFHWIQSENKFVEYPWYPDSLRSIRIIHNQTLDFKLALEDSDDGLYKCVLIDPLNGSTIFQHEFNITLLDCDMDSVPVPLERLTGEITVELGGNISIPCKGKFACPNSDVSFRNSRQAYWLKDAVRITDTDKRFQTEQTISDYELIGESVLTITNLQEKDISAQLTCVVDDGRNKTSWSTNLKEKYKGQGKTVVQTHWIVISVVLPIIIIISVIIVILLWHPQLHFWFKSTFCKNCFEVDGGISITIVHGEDDTDAMRFIKHTLHPKLLEFGHSCLVLKDLPAGRTQLGGGSEMITQSKAIIVVQTKNSLEDGPLHYLVNLGLHLKDNIFCILYEEKDLKVLRKGVTSRYAGLTLISWPTKGKESKRRLKNFWCRLRLILMGLPKNNASTIPNSNSNVVELQNFL